MRGNHNRWHVNRQVSDPDCEYCHRVPDREPDQEPDWHPDQVSESAPIRPVPVPVPDPQTTSRRKPAKRLPDSWVPTDEHRERCLEKGIDIEAQVERFKLHAEANDRRQVNWNAAFTQWLLNAKPTLRSVPQTPYPANGTKEEQDAWVRAQPLPPGGAYYGGSAR